MKLMVGFDGSEGSLRALRWAIGLVGPAGPPVRVVHVWQYPPESLLEGIPRLTAPSGELQAELEARLAELIETERLAGRVEAKVVEGPTVTTLSAFAEVTGAHALVLGSRGRGGFSGLVLGSVGRACVEHSPVPVVVVPETCELRVPPARILVGVDGSPSARAALEWAIETAAASSAEILAVHAFSPGQTELDRRLADELRARAADGIESWCEPLRASHVPHRVEMREGEPRIALAEAAATEATDLIVVGARGFGKLNRALLGSTASSLVHTDLAPVTVLREQTG